MTAAVQHDRLKSEQKWFYATQGAGHPGEPWSESLAQRMASESGIELTEAHWDVIRYLRDRYTERGFVRRSRELSRELDERFRAQGGIKYLYRLFNGGPVLKACRLAGVPVPENCVDASFGTAF